MPDPIPAPTVAPVAPAAPVETMQVHVIGPDVDNSAPAPETDLTPEQQQLATLTQSFDTFKTESAARDQGFQQTIQTLMTRPAMAAAPAVPEVVAPAVLSFDDLPDPVENPKQFKTAMAERVAQHIATQGESASQALLSQVSRSSALDSLWTRFNGSNPELAKRPALAQGAAAMEFASLRAQGIDPIAIAQSTPDSLIANIVNRMNAEVGPPVVPTVPGALPVVPVTSGVAPVVPTVPNSAARVADLATASALTIPAPAQPKPKSFVDQLKASQIADGLI